MTDEATDLEKREERRLMAELAELEAELVALEAEAAETLAARDRLEEQVAELRQK